MTDLVQTLEDGRKGFADSSDKLAQDGNASVAGTFASLADQRARFSAELRTAAQRSGLSIEPSGSLAGAMHRGWIGLKDAMTGDDADAIVNAALSGEDHAVTEFEKALEGGDLPTDVETTVRTQLATIKTTKSQLESLTS